MGWKKNQDKWYHKYQNRRRLNTDDDLEYQLDIVFRYYDRDDEFHGWRCSCWRCDYAGDHVLVTGNSTGDMFIYTLHKLRIKPATQLLYTTPLWRWSL